MRAIIIPRVKNLLDIVKTLVLGMGLGGWFAPNAHGNWGGQIIDLNEGMASAVPLKDDMLPCLQLVGAKKMPYASVPDSLAKLAEKFAAAAVAKDAEASGASGRQRRRTQTYLSLI